ncbi:hypothetical protein ACCO45_012030 [Purpureocillium lilacinum]|uniref:Uncharacterized protein n=1 Tax=Purpureocillium lilacinum TaxID=33203 RepID=A0ACC4DER5_PURLI
MRLSRGSRSPSTTARVVYKGRTGWSKGEEEKERMKTPVWRGINGGKSAEKPKGTQEGFIRSEPVRRQRRPGARVPAGRLVRARIAAAQPTYRHSTARPQRGCESKWNLGTRLAGPLPAPYRLHAGPIPRQDGSLTAPGPAVAAPPIAPSPPGNAFKAL